MASRRETFFCSVFGTDSGPSERGGRARMFGHTFYDCLLNTFFAMRYLYGTLGRSSAPVTVPGIAVHLKENDLAIRTDAGGVSRSYTIYRTSKRFPRLLRTALPKLNYSLILIIFGRFLLFCDSYFIQFCIFIF